MYRICRALRRRCLDTGQRADTGTVALFVALVTTTLVLVIGLVVDGGGRMNAAEKADALAAEAARSGGQAIDVARVMADGTTVVEPSAAIAAAEDYLDAAGATGEVAVVGNGTILQVRVTVPFNPSFSSLFGVGEIAVTGTAEAMLVHSVTAPGGNGP